jgi:hypothetical protein
MIKSLTALLLAVSLCACAPRAPGDDKNIYQVAEEWRTRTGSDVITCSPYHFGNHADCSALLGGIWYEVECTAPTGHHSGGCRVEEAVNTECSHGVSSRTDIRSE